MFVTNQLQDPNFRRSSVKKLKRTKPATLAVVLNLRRTLLKEPSVPLSIDVLVVALSINRKSIQCNHFRYVNHSLRSIQNFMASTIYMHLLFNVPFTTTRIHHASKAFTNQKFQKIENNLHICQNAHMLDLIVMSFCKNRSRFPSRHSGCQPCQAALQLVGRRPAGL